MLGVGCDVNWRVRKENLMKIREQALKEPSRQTEVQSP